MIVYQCAYTWLTAKETVLCTCYLSSVFGIQKNILAKQNAMPSLIFFSYIALFSDIYILNVSTNILSK